MQKFKKDQYNWTIIYTDHNREFIHLDHLKKSNPDAQILLADTSNNFNKNFAWRNGDLLYRTWLQNNYDKLYYNNIAILEWDVLVSQKLPDIKINGILGKHIISPNKKWFWFKEKKRLKEYEKYSVGLSPLGVLFMCKNCVQQIVDQKFDIIYQQDIFSELRLPTILNSKNIQISSYSLPNVSWKSVKYKTLPSIYHPIKSKQHLK